jgi:hypothetical protein
MVLAFFVVPVLFGLGYAALFVPLPIDCDWCSSLSCVAMPPDAPYIERWWNCDACAQAGGGLVATIRGGDTIEVTCPRGSGERTGDLVTKVYDADTALSAVHAMETCAEMCLLMAM